MSRRQKKHKKPFIIQSSQSKTCNVTEDSVAIFLELNKFIKSTGNSRNIPKNKPRTSPEAVRQRRDYGPLTQMPQRYETATGLENCASNQRIKTHQTDVYGVDFSFIIAARGSRYTGDGWSIVKLPALRSLECSMCHHALRRCSSFADTP